MVDAILHSVVQTVRIDGERLKPLFVFSSCTGLKRFMRMFVWNVSVKKLLALVALVLLVAGPQAAFAGGRHHHHRHYDYDGPRYAGYGCKSHPVFGVNPGHHKHHARNVWYNDGRYYGTRRDPLVTSTLAGAAIGASTGAVMGKPVLRSALIGTGFGAGLGLLRESGY